MSRSSEQRSREEAARIEIGSTAIRPAVARLLVAGFVLTIAGLPVLQAWKEATAYRTGERETPWPQALEIVEAVPNAVQGLSRGKTGLAQIRWVNASLLNEMERFEDRLERKSLLRDQFLGPMQRILLQLGAGNENTYPGENGWLFYRPGVDYVTGPGLLEPHVLRGRAQTGDYLDAKIQPNPVKAILQFERELQKRGIELIVFPAPVKPSIHPGQFSDRYTSHARPLQNASYRRLVERLRREGVIVFDIARELVERKRSKEEPQFLKRDTHWTPSAMEYAARRLAGLMKARGTFEKVPVDFTRTERQVSHAGDITAMLNLPNPKAIYPLQTVEIHPVHMENGEPWQPQSEAEVLLLGDSFANIYSMEELGWGESAGLAEQLSFFLDRPVDRITQNDSGGFGTRQALGQQMAQGRDRLQGKKFVIWEFAARELSIGNWKTIPLPDMPEKDQSSRSTPERTKLVVEGTVQQAAGMPEPGAVPYREGITSLHLTELTAIQGSSPGEEIVVYLWGMRDNELTEAAEIEAGERVRLELTPWASASSEYGTFTRVELNDPNFELLKLPTFWGQWVPTE